MKKRFFSFLMALAMMLGMLPMDVVQVYAADYDLWLGSTQVTDENKNNILGDGKACFDPDTSTLTLTDVSNVTGQHNDAKIYSALSSLTITGNASLLDDSNEYGIFADGNLTLGGTLSASGKTAGILAGRLTIADGYGITIPFGGEISQIDGKDTVVSGSDQKADRLVMIQPVTDCTVTFDLNGHGEAVPSQTVQYGKKAAKPTDPTAVGWSFDGWYIDQALTIPFDFDTPIAADVTLYAKWTADVVQYTVTFNLNGHGEAIPEQTVQYGKKAAKPTDPAADGWTFDGWYGDEALTTPFDFDVPIEGNTTVYAKWTKIVVVYTVTFDTNGHGGDSFSQTVESGKTVVKPADPKADGWTFGGWYTDKTCKKRFSFTTPVASDVTVYAKWTETPAEKVTYTITKGAKGTWTKNSKVNYILTIQRDPDNKACFSHFASVQIDDKALKLDTDYTAASGSTVITLKASMLQKLENGERTVTVNFDDGSVKTTLTIEPAAAAGTAGSKTASSKTSANSHGMLWVTLLVLSAGVLAAVLIYSKKRNRKE